MISENKISMEGKKRKQDMACHCLPKNNYKIFIHILGTCVKLFGLNGSLKYFIK